MTAENKDSLFFPRTALAQGILATFEKGLQTAATIFAPRRKGKTTFINNDLIPLAKERGFLVANADLWFDKDHPERVIVGALYEAIHGTGFLRRNWMKLLRPGAVLSSVEAGAGADGVNLKAGLAPDSGLDLFELFERFRQLGKGKALLIIDEVQHLATRKEFENLTATLRSLLQRAQGDVYAVFTGSSQDGLHRMFRHTKAPFYQFSHEVEFPNLGYEFIEHLGQRYHEITNREWDVDAAFERYVARGQMPKYIRDVLQLCMNDGLSVQEADYRAWNTMTDEGNFMNLILELPAIDLAVLMALVKGVAVFSAEGLESIGNAIDAPKALSAASVQTALKRLQKRDLVGNLGRGKWQMEDIALESYIRRTLLDPDQTPDTGAN
ncbi:ATP-binding protein [Pseudomonas aeruginosa]|uniref:ATP-binding protein n=1 Tax=Pseudomonas aeruginosa TaxID=287 RepID=UPI000E67C1DF|nr:ATP-binding protein [Pseudomonas aeruginosa]MBA5106205.1 ATP-binding protein [Pseudomonas aeruginosa]MBD1300232.1 ATP-binding protein [Pseudomonas aeruginosa]MBD1340785.1 ATP-binding protein [Pseudomonas aeruginosa]MBG4604189.1 ATP-binding protein [Pseudomonas aeruginosa]MBH3592973.1 ATP-binding protein [Pseudomonas aeruginosa]